jgi:hypothetical protein
MQVMIGSERRRGISRADVVLESGEGSSKMEWVVRQKSDFNRTQQA